MSFITGKHMARRTFLRGMGATVALPFLDAMVPAGRIFASAPSAGRTRLMCIEEVHGLAGCNNWGATKFLYAPETTGRDFALVPDNPLGTLEAFRDYMTIVSNTDVRMAEAFTTPDNTLHITNSAVGEKILFRGTAQHARRLEEVLRLIDVPEAAAGIDGKANPKAGSAGDGSEAAFQRIRTGQYQAVTVAEPV